METLKDWIENKLKEKQWRPADLAKAAGIKDATLSRILNGDRKAGPEVCRAIARALNEPPELVFRLADLLPPISESTQIEEQLLAIFRQLSSQQQQFLIASIRGLQGRPVEITAIRERGKTYLPPQQNIQMPLDPEEITELFTSLDQPEQLMVYDYIQWRLWEQKHRRDSSATHRRSEEEKQREWQQAIKHIDLLTAIDDATPQTRQAVITRLSDILNKLEKKPEEEETN